MTKRVIGDFKQFLNEAEETQELKGLPFEELMALLAKLTDLTADNLEIGTPADIYGHSTSYKTDLSDVQARLADIDHYFASKMKEEVKFYCWNLKWKDYSSGIELEKKLPEGTIVPYQNINLSNLITYFEENPEDAGLLKGLNLSVSSKAGQQFAKDMSAGKYGSLD